MDDKPHHFPPPPLTRQSSVRNEQQQQSESTNERPAKRTRRIVDSSTTCAPEQLHCRYANKKCFNPRAVKRTGGLHTFCAMHRANANRNQRRLDQRKRLARQAQRAQTQGDQTPTTADASTSGTPKATDTDAQYEPLMTPTPLQEEDISTLVTLFLPQSQSREDATFGTQMSLTPPTDRSPSSTNEPPPPPPPGGLRF